MPLSYLKLKQYAQTRAPRGYRLLERYKTYVKYVIAGAAAAFTDLLLLFLLTDVVHIYYLISAMLAFMAAFFVSFYLQKFWTFRDNDRRRIGRQMSLYFIIGLANLAVNTYGMYLLVDIFGVMYLLAQVIMGLLIAIVSYLLYRYMVFGKIRPKY